MEIVKKNDFVELSYTGYSQGKVFDSNVEKDLKILNPGMQAKPLVIVVGQKMLVPGFDEALEGKEIGKVYDLELKPKEAFGERRRELVKMIPLKIFMEKKIYPQAGMVLNMDNSIAKVLAVSGARVTVDFNNPLAGKDVHYTFTIMRKVIDENEKAKSLIEATFQFVPEFEVKDEIVIKGPKFFEVYVKAFSEKFKELIGKPLKFELKEMKKEEPKTAENEELKSE